MARGEWNQVFRGWVERERERPRRRRPRRRLARSANALATVSLRAPSMQRWACCIASVVCLIGGAFLAEPVTQSVADPGPEVRRTLERGEYEKAERLAVEWHSRVQAAHGSDSIELARASDLLVEALLENGKAAAATTLAVAERSVAAKERALGRDHVELAVSLDSLGKLRGVRGDFRAALTLFERALVD